jgi:acetyl esterase/lipase
MAKIFLRNLPFITALTTLLLGILHFFRVRTPRQVVLRTLKSTAQAVSPVLVLTGLLSAGLGARIHSTLSLLVGLAGSALSARYILRVQQAKSTVAPLARDFAGFDGRYEMLRNINKSPRWLRDVPFWQDPTTGQILRCDLWQPPEGCSPSGLAFLYLHGGGFFTSEKDFGTRSFFRHLCRQGHTIMDANYRLAPEHDLFSMQVDVRRAIAWLKAHATEYAIDPQRIVLAGGSAGGLLALLAAYTPDQPDFRSEDLRHADLRVRGVVSYYGVVDLDALARKFLEILPAFSPQKRATPNLLYHRAAAPVIKAAAWLKGVESDPMRRYLIENAILLEMGPRKALTSLVGGLPDTVPERYRLLSPSTHVKAGCPATLLLHGAHDHLLPVEPTARMYHQLVAAGVPAVFLELPETEHTFDLFLPEISPPAHKALHALDRFLACL